MLLDRWKALAHDAGILQRARGNPLDRRIRLANPGTAVLVLL
jgi:hypothetical protein